MGDISKLALPPGSDVSSYHRKVLKNVSSDTADKRLQIIRVPAYHKADRSRIEINLPVVPPHESFAQEVEPNPGMLEHIKHEDTDWSHNYLKHPAVVTPGPPTLPGAFYVDGVPYSQNDGVIGFWFYSRVTQVRHLCVVVRRRHLCKCGCQPQGWCTLNAILTYLAWSLAALVKGQYPTMTHEQKPWDPDGEHVRCRMVAP